MGTQKLPHLRGGFTYNLAINYEVFVKRKMSKLFKS